MAPILISRYCNLRKLGKYVLENKFDSERKLRPAVEISDELKQINQAISKLKEEIRTLAIRLEDVQSILVSDPDNLSSTCTIDFEDFLQEYDWSESREINFEAQGIDLLCLGDIPSLSPMSELYENLAKFLHCTKLEVREIRFAHCDNLRKLVQVVLQYGFNYCKKSSADEVLVVSKTLTPIIQDASEPIIWKAMSINPTSGQVTFTPLTE